MVRRALNNPHWFHRGQKCSSRGGIRYYRTGDITYYRGPINRIAVYCKVYNQIDDDPVVEKHDSSSSDLTATMITGY